MLFADKSEHLDLQCMCKDEIQPHAKSHNKKLKIILVLFKTLKCYGVYRSFFHWTFAWTS